MAATILQYKGADLDAGGTPPPSAVNGWDLEASGAVFSSDPDTFELTCLTNTPVQARALPKPAAIGDYIEFTLPAVITAAFKLVILCGAEWFEWKPSGDLIEHHGGITSYHFFGGEYHGGETIQILSGGIDSKVFYFMRDGVDIADACKVFGCSGGEGLSLDIRFQFDGMAGAVISNITSNLL